MSYQEARQHRLATCIGQTCLLVCCLFCFIGLLSAALRPAESPAPCSADRATIDLGTPSLAALSTVDCPLAVSRDLPAALDALAVQLRRTAGGANSIAYSVYASDPERYAGRTVELRNADFSAGTIRLRTSGVFVLVEDVRFEPRADIDFVPDRTSLLYSGPAFTLGFFAALTVEAHNVLIDLGGHRLDASPLFAVEQRFYSHIELAGAPFIATQGPLEFGNATDTVNGLIIENGALGRSSHHALHGNGGQRVLIRDLTIGDYEVAALSLNGFRDVVVRNVSITGQFTSIPVLGTYANARFIRQFARRVAGDEGRLANVTLMHRNRVGVALVALERLLGQVRNDITTKGHIDGVLHAEAEALFANRRGLADGNSYAIVIHPFGAAVGPFWPNAVPSVDAPGSTQRVLFEGVRIANTSASIVEVVALWNRANDQTVRGPAGELFRLVDNAGRVATLLDEAAGGRYAPNALSELQLALMEASLDVGDEVVRKRLFGTINSAATRPMLEWTRGDAPLADFVTPTSARRAFEYRRNGDTMFHVNKGVTAFRLDGVRDVCLSDISIESTSNDGARGLVSALPGEANDEEAAYVGAIDGGHPQQALQYGYMGADARALSIAASTGVYLRRVRVDGVTSTAGYARGIDLFNAANGTFVGDGCSVSNVASGATLSGVELAARGQFDVGPRTGVAIGLCVDASACPSSYGLTSVRVTNVSSAVLNHALLLAIDAPGEFSAELLNASVLSANTYQL